MKYDPSLIKTEVEVINGKEIKIQKIPVGMGGPNAGIFADSEDLFSKEEYEEFNSEDPEVYQEFMDYVDEGIEPDLDEVRAFKETLEEEYTPNKILDSIESEVDYVPDMEMEIEDDLIDE